MPETFRFRKYRTICPDPWSIFDTPKIYWQFGKPWIPPPLLLYHQQNTPPVILKYPLPPPDVLGFSFFQAFDPTIRRLYQALADFGRKSWDIFPNPEDLNMPGWKITIFKRLFFRVSGCFFSGCSFGLLFGHGFFWGIFCWKFYRTWGSSAITWNEMDGDWDGGLAPQKVIARLM